MISTIEAIQHMEVIRWIVILVEFSLFLLAFHLMGKRNVFPWRTLLGIVIFEATVNSYSSLVKILGVSASAIALAVGRLGRIESLVDFAQRAAKWEFSLHSYFQFDVMHEVNLRLLLDIMAISLAVWCLIRTQRSVAIRLPNYPEHMYLTIPLYISVAFPSKTVIPAVFIATLFCVLAYGVVLLIVGNSTQSSAVKRSFAGFPLIGDVLLSTYYLLYIPLVRLLIVHRIPP